MDFLTLDAYRRLRLSDPECVVHLVETQLRGAPEDYLFLIEAGHASLATGDRTKGLEFFQRSFEINPANSHAAYTLANALCKQGMSGEGASVAAAYLRTHGFHENCFGVLVRCDAHLAIEMSRELRVPLELPAKVAASLATAYARLGRWGVAAEIVTRSTSFSQHRSRLMLTVMIRAGFLRIRTPTIGAKPTPVIQYWDTGAPPPDVASLMARAKAYAVGGYRSLDREHFAQLARRHLGLSAPRILGLCEHPAAQSDVARLLWLVEYGGSYLDADMTTKREDAFCLQFDRCFLTVADNLTFPVITNWFIASQPEDPFLYDCIDTLGQTISEEAFSHLTIFDVTGPGILTQVFVDRIATDSLADCLWSEGSLSEFFAYNGDLEYKRHASKNWALLRGDMCILPGGGEVFSD